MFLTNIGNFCLWILVSSNIMEFSLSFIYRLPHFFCGQLEFLWKTSYPFLLYWVDLYNIEVKTVYLKVVNVFQIWHFIPNTITSELGNWESTLAISMYLPRKCSTFLTMSFSAFKMKMRLHQFHKAFSKNPRKQMICSVFLLLKWLVKVFLIVHFSN